MGMLTLRYFGWFEHSIDKSILHSTLGRHIDIAVCVFGNLFLGLTGVVSQNAVELFAETQNLLGLDLDIRGLPLRTAQRLMHMNGGIRKSIPLAAGSRVQKNCAKARREANGHGANWRANKLHRVIDCQTGIDHTARAVDE